jgi:hypothetical protein
MNYMEIKAVGKASEKVISKFKEACNSGSLSNNEVLMFCSFSEFDIPTGKEFNTIKDIEGKFEINSHIILKNVTQQLWKPFDSIPAGWRTICLFEFILGDIPSIVQELPTINDWYDSDTGVWLIG